MLSYQHLYHAGNPADVHKHALMAAMLDHMAAKPKKLSYIETHSGRGLYDLTAPEAVKTGEAAAGITRMQGLFRPDHPYIQMLERVRAAHGAHSYPGSPMVASHMLRTDDAMHLAELHPQEHDALRKVMKRRARIYRQDGFELAQSLCPPDPRRGLLLIDPSYEIKEDYARLPKFIATLHRKWNVGVIALWYPILISGAQAGMVRALRGENFPKALCHEVRFPPVRDGHRMIGSGMFVINAPFGLEDEAKMLSRLFQGMSGA